MLLRHHRFLPLGTHSIAQGKIQGADRVSFVESAKYWLDCTNESNATSEGDAGERQAPNE